MKVRAISVIILAPLVILTVIAGGYFFSWMLVAIFLIAAYEYVRMFSHQHDLALPLVTWFVLAWMLDPLLGWPQWLGLANAGGLLASAAWELYRAYREPECATPTALWALTVAGGMYLGMGGAHLLKVRFAAGGMGWLLTLLLTVWTADTGAYLIGSRWGRHKIAPTISPNKSWEGYIAELVSGILAGGICGYYWPQLTGDIPGLTWITGSALGLLLAALTPFGDFFISMIKREVNVKDTGALIPGHGGILDRLDSLIWAGVLTWAVMQFN